MTKLFYTETGYDRTIVKFYELVKETKSFYTLVQIGKYNYNNGVTPNRSELKGDTLFEAKGKYLSLNLQIG